MLIKFEQLKLTHIFDVFHNNGTSPHILAISPCLPVDPAKLLFMKMYSC
jgi:hypothetical protein